jgi:ribA/ribD-fused uncharacterized protein
MESIVTTQVVDQLSEFINISKKDPKAEVECKLLSGKIQTKDVADRILKEIMTLAIGVQSEEHRLTIAYPDGNRVVINDVRNIQKLCLTNSFKEVPLEVQKKIKYFDGSKDVIDSPEASARFTLRSEQIVRKDWEGNPSDPKGHIRMLHRKSFKTANELFRIDFSMVKTRPANSKKTVRDMMKQTHFYELEIEFVNRESKIDSKLIVGDLLKIMTKLSEAYYQTPFLLPVSDIQRYQQEFKMTSNVFLNPVTLVRRHLKPDNLNSIMKDYTVTNKADGYRVGLYVARDRRVLLVRPTLQLVWAGITANDDSHSGDFLDGEFIADKNLFCIFDVYRFRNRDVRNLPLMKTGESRLNCAKMFIEDLRSQFNMTASLTPLRIETKLFLAGDGIAMEEAIKTMLSTEFEYETDGLVFTPRSSPVAPAEDRKGKTWLRVYKWKPPHLNTIDFLIKILPDETFDPIAKVKAKKAELYVSRTPGDDIIYPRETMTGEYVPRKLPDELQRVAESNTRVPSVFQPVVPRDPDAYQLHVPTNERDLAVDSSGNRVEDNTIVECSFDVETRRWNILRTRYDKTFQYRVLHEPQYGNDIATANSVWTSIHIPVTSEMIQNFVSNPPDDTYEDDMYYRDDLKRCSRIFNDVYDFHNRIKDEMYKENIKKDDTLLELAVGRGGDLNKWKRVKPSKVVGVDISESNITSPTQGSAVRYINDKKKHPRDFLPPCLFVVGDMSAYPLFEQEDKYMPILTGKEKASTAYLADFEDLTSFNAISCQFALHYACESEEIFRAFAKNLQKYGKGVFFGTCSDGKSIYTLLAGKKAHLFGAERQVCGEYSKEYEDRESWKEEFGMPVKVFLESFDRPAIEYLVPFEKVVSILEEHGYELAESKLFGELYANQTSVTLTPEQQTFSFLNRTFVFKRSNKTKKIEEPEPLPEPPVETPIEVKKRKLRKVDEGPPPVLFHGADESKGEFRNFSNMSAHKIMVDGKEYQTVEHFYQAKKAEKFDDKESLEKIMKAKSAKAVKALGKKVKDFKQDEWDLAKYEIMKQGVSAKFSQYPEVRKQLEETGDRKIGFADARNVYWGIGSSESVEKSKHPEKWRGKNMLGHIIMELRDS